MRREAHFSYFLLPPRLNLLRRLIKCCPAFFSSLFCLILIMKNNETANAMMKTATRAPEVAPKDKSNFPKGVWPALPSWPLASGARWLNTSRVEYGRTLLMKLFATESIFKSSARNQFHPLCLAEGRRDRERDKWSGRGQCK